MKKKKLKRIIEGMQSHIEAMAFDRDEAVRVIAESMNTKEMRDFDTLQSRIDDLTRETQRQFCRAGEEKDSQLREIVRSQNSYLAGSKERILELEKQIAAVRLEHDRTRARVGDMMERLDFLATERSEA